MAPRKLPALYVGASGWHYTHWKGPFYPEKMPSREFLGHYVQYFRAAEVNNTFYQLPKPETLEQWRDSVPEGFRFAVKASRYITHMKKLKDPEQGLAKFFGGVEVLGEKLGPVLFQLPPNLKVDLNRLETFVEALPSEYRYAFEFRSPEWWSETVFELLDRRGAAVCAADPAELDAQPAQSELVYARLHGPHGDYTGRYSDAALEDWAARLHAWRVQGREVYCFFNNDQGGAAPLDAQVLLAKLEEKAG